MDKILSIDISSSPLTALVMEVSDAVRTVVDVVEVTLKDPDFFERLSREQYHELIEDEHETSIEHSDFISLREELVAITDLKKKHLDDLVSTVLIVPPCSYLSLNLSLPFVKDSVIKKVIGLEVQDQIPFDVNNFVINHNKLGQLPDGSNDIHAAMLPKNYIGKLIDFCRSIRIDPEYLTTPSAVLTGFADHQHNQLVLSAVGDRIYLNGLFDGTVRSAQIIEPETSGEIPTANIKMLVNYLEDRYQEKLEQVLLIGNTLPAEEIEKELGLAVVTPKEFEQEFQGNNAMISWLAAYSASNEKTKMISNFRVGEFAYNPFGRAVGMLFSRLWIYLLALCCLALLVPAVSYIGRANEIKKLRKSIRTDVTEHVPGLDLKSGEELASLAGHRNDVQDQLDGLGQKTKANPFDIYIVLNEILEKPIRKTKMNLSEIEIKGHIVEIVGSVEDYHGVEQIERVLKKKGDLFCGIKTDTSNSRSSGRKFKFRIELC